MTYKYICMHVFKSPIKFLFFLATIVTQHHCMFEIALTAFFCLCTLGMIAISRFSGPFAFLLLKCHSSFLDYCLCFHMQIESPTRLGRG